MTVSDIQEANWDTLLAIFQPIFNDIEHGAIERETNRQLPFEQVKQLLDAGFGRVRIPVAAGGLGASLPQYLLLLTALAKADSNIAQIFRAHSAFIEAELLQDNRDVQDRWFPVLVQGGFIGAAMSEKIAATDVTVYLEQKQDGGWVLNGKKYYSTGTLYADWMTVYAKYENDLAMVMVQTTAQGVMRLDDWDGFGQRLTGSGTTIYDNVDIPKHHLIRFFGKDGMPSAEFMAAYFQLYHLATIAGIVQAELKDAIAYTHSRTRTFRVPGETSPRQDPLVQRVIGRISSIAYAIDAIVRQNALSLDQYIQGQQRPIGVSNIEEPIDVRVYQAQQIILGLAQEASGLIFEVGGASSVSRKLQLDRHWRNVRTLASHNPASQREQALGNFYLNDVEPTIALHVLHRAITEKRHVDESVSLPS
ncbi:MAG: acyl-CoA dehydrogenase family protein [Acinetobacter populi]|jgi:alkylation response protein AidB-like acyl-CoA dehydrogenase|uniref:acyl-CoA dehydrogenase family protein n=1 Tax=Acinetobacter populi TaxID=1582270 RepID=UPI002353AC96|nr:acyl-CoA dehydrogenase family protein [Acinetobacter populi]MCH4247123.1 acyl-CoA dehydrogenase family protein [Acinetobacter populi]